MRVAETRGNAGGELSIAKAVLARTDHHRSCIFITRESS
jgi:hypothetical protein